MKTGKTLGELAAEIERQAQSKRDFVAPTSALTIEGTSAGTAVVHVKDRGAFGLGKIAQEQIAEHTGIPAKYAAKMLAEAPKLYADNVNTWFEKYPAVRMARMLDGNCRAFLSDKYQPFDNYDFAAALLPVIQKRNLEVMSCEITEKRLYIKAVDKQLFRDVPVGHKMGDGTHTIFHTCAPALICSNSEVGYGRYVIEHGAYTEACTNMALFAKGGLKRTHVGARHALTNGMDAEDLENLLSSETKRKSMEALFLQSRDVIEAAFNADLFTKRCDQLTAASQNVIPAAKLEAVMDYVQEKFTFNTDERNSVFQHLIEGGQLSQYGLHAAITRAAQDVADYDRATEMEYLGGKVIELERNDWRQLAEAK